MGYVGAGVVSSTSNREDVFSYSTERDIYYATADTASGSNTEFVSYADSNSITVDGTGFALDEYDTDSYPGASLSYAQTDVFSTLGPITGGFDNNSTGPLVPASAAGTAFTYRMDRYTNEFSFVSPWCSSDIEIRNSTNAIVTGGSITVASGGSAVVNTTNTAGTGIPNDDMVIIESTNGCPFLVTHTGSNTNDSMVLYPAAEEWYGVGSGGIHFSVLQNSTDVTIYKSTGAANVYTGLNRGDEITVNDAGSQGSEVAHRVVATNPIGVNALADGDGTEAVSFMPADEMGSTFYFPQDMQYIAISTITDATTTVDLYNDGTNCGVGVPDDTATVTPVSPRPGKVYFGSTTNGTHISAGACIVANNPISPYYEYHDGSAYGDETAVWGPKQNRQFIYPEPTDAAGGQNNGSWSLGTADTFSRRKAVDITNNSTTDAIDEYAYRLVISGGSYNNLFNQAQTDGGDLRVAGATGDGTDNYDYWLEEYDSAAKEAVLWIQTDSIAASGTNTFYIYYNASSTLSTTGDEVGVFSYTSLQEAFYVVDDHWRDDRISLISFIDSNQVNDGTVTEDLDEGEIVSLPAGMDQGDVYSVTLPIHAAFDADTTDAASPIGWAGTEFSGNAARDSDVFSFYAPYADATVEVYSEGGGGWTLQGSVAVTQGTTGTLAQDITTGDAFYISSDEPVLAFHRNSTSDSKPLYPVDQAYEESTGMYELYGVATNAILLSATDAGTTNVTIYQHNSAATISATLDATTDYAYTGAGGQGAQGQAVAMRVVSDKPIAASSYADSDGGETAIFLPAKEFSDTYALPHDAQYFAMVAKDASVECRVYDAAGTEVTSGPATMDNVPPQTGGANALPRPNLIHIGGNDTTDGAFFTAGYSMVCDEPVYAFYEHHLNTTITDETSWLSWPQVRQRDHANPVVEDIDSTNEEGLYYASGFDSAGAGSDPEAYMEIEIDSGSEHTYWHDVEWTVNLGSPETETNSVEPLEVEAAYANSTTCATATYSAYTSIATDSLDTFPDEFSDNQCVRLRIYLRTGDEAYSPNLLQFLVHYYVPTQLADILNTPAITIAGNTSGTAIRQRILKATTADPSLAGSELFTTFTDISSAVPFTSLDLELLEIPSQTITTQFNWPTFPGSRTDAANTSPFDASNAVALYISHDRAAGATEQVNLEVNTDVEAAAGPLISEPFDLNIGGWL